MTSADPVEPRPEIDPDEVARLREEVARLKAEKEPPAPGGRRGWWRPVVAGLLVAVAALLAPLSVLSTWASGQIQDTDRYLATVAPLASDPDVQAAIVVRVEEVIYSYLDLDAAVDEVVQALEGQGLPPRAAATLGALAGPLTTGIRSFVHDRIVALVASDAFEEAWVEANRTAHEELVAALTGRLRGSRRGRQRRRQREPRGAHQHPQGAAGRRRLRHRGADSRGGRDVHDRPVRRTWPSCRSCSASWTT